MRHRVGGRRRGTWRLGAVTSPRARLWIGRPVFGLYGTRHGIGHAASGLDSISSFAVRCIESYRCTFWLRHLHSFKA